MHTTFQEKDTGIRNAWQLFGMAALRSDSKCGVSLYPACLSLILENLSAITDTHYHIPS
jgi:hypothetical protein